MRKYVLYLYIALLAALLPLSGAQAERLMGETNILCGYEDGQHGGKVQTCDISTQKCIVCRETKDSLTNTLTVKRKIMVYRCVAQSDSVPRNCELAVNGGLKGAEWTSVFFGLIKANKEKGTECIPSNFVVKYSGCYGCTVVQTLTSAFVKAAGNAYNVSRQAANVIVLIGMALWLAMFALKNVSSFATLEPMKMLQEFFVQCFKVILAMVIINSGLRTIMDYTLVPIMTVGTNVADAVSASVMDAIAENKIDLNTPSSAILGYGGSSSVTGGNGYTGGGSGGGGR